MLWESFLEMPFDRQNSLDSEHVRVAIRVELECLVCQNFAQIVQKFRWSEDFVWYDKTVWKAFHAMLLTGRHTSALNEARRLHDRTARARREEAASRVAEAALSAVNISPDSSRVLPQTPTRTSVA